MHLNTCIILLIILTALFSTSINDNPVRVLAFSRRTSTLRPALTFRPASPSWPCWQGDVQANNCVEFLMRSRGWSRETTLSNIAQVKGFQSNGVIPLEVHSETKSRYSAINVAVVCMQSANLLPMGDDCAACGTLCPITLNADLCALYCPGPPPISPKRPILTPRRPSTPSTRPLPTARRATLALNISTALAATTAFTSTLEGVFEHKEASKSKHSEVVSTEISKDGVIM